MSTEPDFLSQNGEPLRSHERLQWFSKRANEAVAKGARWHRFSVHPTEPHLLLHEAWHVKPIDADGNLDEGQPRWQFSAAKRETI